MKPLITGTERQAPAGPRSSPCRRSGRRPAARPWYACSPLDALSWLLASLDRSRRRYGLRPDRPRPGDAGAGHREAVRPGIHRRAAPTAVMRDQVFPGRCGPLSEYLRLMRKTAALSIRPFRVLAQPDVLRLFPSQFRFVGLNSRSCSEAEALRRKRSIFWPSPGLRHLRQS